MGVGSLLKRTVKANTNVSAWSSWDAVRNSAGVVMSFARSLKPQAVTLEQETFEEAVRRYQLTEAQLQHRMNSYYRVAILCAILAVAALTWMVFLFVKAMIFPGIAALSLALLMFAYSFSEHFRYFLIRERRLGCTMSEWFFSLFGRKRSNTHE